MLVLAVLGACGDDAATNPPDAALPPDAAPAAGVRLSLTVRGTPAAGARVVFLDPAGAVVRDTTTGADGTAFAELAAGSVTVVEPRPVVTPEPMTIHDRLATFTGVAVGDELRLDLMPLEPTVEVTLSVPSDGDAMTFEVLSTCGRGMIPAFMGEVMPAPVTLDACGTTDLFVISGDGIGSVLHGMYRPNIAVPAGATIVLPGPWEDLVASTVTATNVPAWIGNIGVDQALVTPRRPVVVATGFLDPGAPTTTLQLPPPSGLPGALRFRLFPTAGMAESLQRIVAWGLSAVDPSVDLGALALAPYTTAPRYDAATRTIAWTEGTGAPADLVRAELHVFREGDPAHTWDWQIVAARGAAPSVSYPVLPVLDFDFNVQAGDSAGVRELETAAVPGGYAAVRSRALRTRLDLVGATPAGRVAYQAVFVQE